MADGTIDIDTQIDGDGAEQGLQELQGRLEATGKKMSELGKGMSAGLTAPIMAVGGMALKTASDFESANGKMQAQLGLTGAETEKYGDMAQDMWKNAFGENIGDVTNAIATVKQNMTDLNDSDLQKVTENAFILQDVFEADIAQSTKTASVMMKNFGIDSTKAMDLMTVGFQKGGNYSDELLDTMNEYSPIFSTMGHSAEDMMNILISGVEAGSFSLDKIGDSVKEFNIRAKDGSKSTAEGFEAIGMDAEVMGAKIAAGGKEGEAAFQATIAGLAAMKNETERNDAGVKLFGATWEDLESDVITAMTNGTNHVEGFEGATKRAGDAAYDTFGSRLTTLWRTTQESLIPLGQTMLDLAEKIIPPLIAIVTTLADWFSGLNGGVQMGIVVFGGLLAAIGPVLVVIGTVVGAIAPLLPALSKAWTLLSKLRTIFTVLRTAMLVLTGPVGIVIAIITGLAILIYKNWDTIKEKTAAVFGWLGEFLPQVWEKIKAAAAIFFEVLKMAFSAGLEWIKNLFSTIWTAISTGASIFWTALVTFAQAGLALLVSVVTSILTGIATFFTAIWNGLVLAATTAWQLIVAGVTMYINFVKTVITTVLTAIAAFFTAVWNGIKLVVTTVWTAIVTAITTAINLVKTVITTVFNAIKTVITTVLNTLKTMFVNAFNFIKSTVTTAVNAVRTVITTVFNAIRSFVTTAVNGIKTVITTVFNAIRSFITTVVNNIKATMVSTWNTIKNAVTTAVNAIKSTVTNVFNSIKSAISNTMSGIKTTVSNAFNSVLDTVKGLGTKFYNAGKGLIEQIIKGIKSMVGSIKDEMTALAAKMRDFLPFSPAKTGPLSDLDKLDFGGPIGDSIKSALPLVRSKMSHLLQMPQLAGPDSGRAAIAAAGTGSATVTHGDTVNHFTVNTQKGQELNVRQLSQELHRLQKRDQKGAGRK